MVLGNEKISIEEISKSLAEANGYPADMVKNNIMANVAVALTITNNIRKEINAIYDNDKRKYYEAAKNSTGYEHIIITMGNIEQEIYAKRALGIIICAEEDSQLRSKIIKIIRKYYPEVYQAIKNGNRRLLIEKYSRLTRLKGETAYKYSRIDGGLTIYLALYLERETENSDLILNAFNDINKFENANPITSNLDQEIEMHKEELKIIKSKIKKIFSSITNHEEILEHNDIDISNLAREIKNIFTLDKLDMEETFTEVDTVNIDSIIISYIKMGYEKHEISQIERLVAIGVFIKLLLKEYRKARKLYFENNKETLYFELEELDNKLKQVIKDNTTMQQEINKYKEKITSIDRTLEEEKNKLRKEYDKEVIELKREISKLKCQINGSEDNKQELNELREMMFLIKQDYVPKKEEVSLKELIKDKRIVIIGGTNDWRIKVKDKYTNIITIDGFNEGFDISILNNINFVFFYTGYMNHGTYYKAINIIRNKEIPFGYIGKTNVDLIEREMIDILQRHEF